MQIKADVDALRKFNFDSWKLDGCGGEKNLTLFNQYVTETGRAIQVENCHWGSVVRFGLCVCSCCCMPCQFLEVRGLARPELQCDVVAFCYRPLLKLVTLVDQ